MIDPKTRHELVILVSTLEMLYEDVNDATMLDLPGELVEAMDGGKGAIDELKRTIQDFLESNSGSSR